MWKMLDFEGGPQGTLNQGKGLEASRATPFLSKSSASRWIGESVSRLIGVSAHRLAGLAILGESTHRCSSSSLSWLGDPVNRLILVSWCIGVFMGAGVSVSR